MDVCLKAKPKTDSYRKKKEQSALRKADAMSRCLGLGHSGM